MIDQDKAYAGDSSRLDAAFTLVELLVVIAIIALLVSITIPAIGRALEGGRRAACGGHLRSIHVAMISHASDNYDLLPAVNPPPLNNNSEIWPYALARQLGYADIQYGTEWGAGLSAEQRVRRGTVYHCPSWSRSIPYRRIPAGANHNWRRYWGFLLGGYGMNRTLDVPVGQNPSGDWGGQLNNRASLSGISNPSRRMLVADGSGVNADLDTHWNFNSAGTPGYDYKVDIERHGDGGNILFVDGRVILMETSVLIEEGRSGRLHGYQE